MQKEILVKQLLDIHQSVDTLTAYRNATSLCIKYIKNTTYIIRKKHFMTEILYW